MPTDVKLPRLGQGMRMTPTCDHRAIDGADGAAFPQTLVALVEQPSFAL